jgi:hypothetical protein
MQKLAKELDVVLVVPLFEKQAKGVYRNSAAIIDADGSLLGVYRKMHIPDDPLFNEKYYFAPGDTAHDDRIDRIGEVAKRVGTTPRTIRYYEEIGILPGEGGRESGRHRLYGEREVQRLTDALATVAFDVEHHAGRVDSETGWTYMGIDLSPAPSPGPGWIRGSKNGCSPTPPRRFRNWGSAVSKANTW